jgi:hypothetical protein
MDDSFLANWVRNPSTPNSLPLKGRGNQQVLRQEQVTFEIPFPSL